MYLHSIGHMYYSIYSLYVPSISTIETVWAGGSGGTFISPGCGALGISAEEWNKTRRGICATNTAHKY